MPRLFILLIGLTFTAASCNLSDPFSYTSGERGVFKSEDAAESFQVRNKLTPNGSLNNVSVNILVFDARNTDVIYLGSGNGLYKTEDAGASWKYMLTGIGIADVAVDFFQPQKLYAAGISGNNGKIIKSQDGGVSWSDAYSEPSKGNAVTAIAISTTSSNLIVAGLATGEVIRSTDSGITWQTVRDLEDRVLKLKFLNNTVYALTSRKGLFRSTDSGTTWASVTSILVSESFISSGGALSVSVFYDFVLDPRQSSTVYVATEEGMIRTVNDGANWSLVNLPVRDSGLKVSALAINPNNSNNIYGGIASTMVKSVNGGVTWETQQLRTEQSIRQILIDFQSPNVIYLGLGDKK